MPELADFKLVLLDTVGSIVNRGCARKRLARHQLQAMEGLFFNVRPS